jgi:MerR family transcriptional regulator, heat shock protein HspR
MNEQDVTHIVIQQSHSPLWYSEQEAAKTCHLSIGTIRHLRTLSLVEGQGISEELRYSEEEIIQLRRIRRLQHDLGINLAGVEVILRLLKRLQDAHQELEKEREREGEREGLNTQTQ